MCETRDLGIKWPQWHTLMFEGQETVDMRVVCPQDVKKMLLRQARMACWRMRAAKHERRVDRQAPYFDAKACCGRRLGTVKILRYRLVRRKEVSTM